MSGAANFPVSLDDDTSLYDVSDGTSTLQAAHHNNMKEAIKKIEAAIGVRGTSVATSIEYRLGHPTFGHNHSGATGMGGLISQSNPTAYLIPHPTIASRVSFATSISALTPADSPTYGVYVFLDHESIILQGGRYTEYAVNDYAAGGNRLSKHYFYGGWGMVEPALATSGVVATYSEEGQHYWDSVAKKLRVYTGATWRSLAFE